MTEATTSEIRLRQQPGLACEKCRKRKARCDRVRPQCGTCAENDYVCVILDKKQRGPKKGQLKALRNQIETLEQQLVGQFGYVKSDAVQVDSGCNTTPPKTPAIFDDREMEYNMACMDMELNMAQIAESSTQFPELLPNLASATANCAVFTGYNDIASLTPDHTPGPSLDITDLMRADLDQLYFDRVHDIAPIIYKRRYFSWSSQENLTPVRACLRTAMWTIAAAASTQFSGLNETLYGETRRMLESLDVGEHNSLCTTGSIQLEQIQAWLLLAHYEFLRISEHQAMLTAGRAFRLVQLSRLYNVDICNNDSDDNFAEVEERRRTLWLAFTFDRFLCMRNECPLTLHEEILCTRLPAPEPNFQNNQPTEMGFLPEAIASSDWSTLSPFAGCIVFATLYGRCMTHRQLALATILFSKESTEFWTRHEQLATIIEKWTQLLVQNSTSTSVLVERDPMLAFTYMLAQSAVIYLNNIIETMQWQNVEHQIMVIMYEQRAYQAVSNTVQLAKELPRFSCFKVHPFLPNVLSYAVIFLMTHTQIPELVSWSEKVEDDCIKQLFNVLRIVKDINISARELLYRLEKEARTSGRESLSY